MHNHQDAALPLSPPEIVRRLLAVEAISDGTKLPMVVVSTQNHHRWYESVLIPLKQVRHNGRMRSDVTGRLSVLNKHTYLGMNKLARPTVLAIYPVGVWFRQQAIYPWSQEFGRA